MKNIRPLINVVLYFFIGFTLMVILIIYGWDYYSTTIEERFFHHKHALLKPSGTIGHGLGIIGSLMIVIGVSSYMIRKRWRKLFHVGQLKQWLEFHIFMCSVGPMLVLFHTAFKFGGIISIGFWSMVIVVLSGIVGRIIYIQLPRTVQGIPESFEEIEEDINKLLSTIDKKVQTQIKNFLEKNFSDYTILPSDQDFLKSLKSVIVFNNIKRKNLNALRRLIKNNKELTHSDKRKIIGITKKILSFKNKQALYNSFESLFRYWHIFHLPFAITMFFLMFIHIIVAIIFGSTWIF